MILQLQDLLIKAKNRIEYFNDINLDIIAQWVAEFNECENLFNQLIQNQDAQKFQEISSTLQKLISEIEIIKTEGMTLVGKFKPWMSGIGMIDFPYGYKIYGQITFGILNGKGVIINTKSQMKLIGIFNNNKLQGNGTIILRNKYEINAQFDNGKITSGLTLIRFFNGVQREITTNLIIDQNQVQYMNLNYIIGQDFQYIADEFIQNQRPQSSFKILQNQNLIKEYRDKRLINGSGFNEIQDNERLHGMFQDGVLKGQGRLTDRENNLILKGEFENNRFKSGIKYYFQSQNIHENGNFDENRLLYGQGIRYYDYPDRIHEQGQFNNGLLHGVGERFYNLQINDQDETFREMGQFENGILIEGTKFYQNGNIKEKGTFNQQGLIGEGERRHSNGYIWEYGIFKNGLLNSENEKSGRVNDQGVFIEIGYFINGSLQGEGERYYNNQQKKETGYFKEGLLHGKGIKYYNNQNNQIQEEGVYKDNQLHSQEICIQYYEDGSIKSQGSFQNGLLNTNDGALYFNEYEMRGVFRNGQVSGTMRIYNRRTNTEFVSHEFQGNENFLRQAYVKGVYNSNKLNTNAESSEKRQQ
ncbi:unnamed protein product [Paramecium sonneborni]|uniref:MORN repeat protein n=1 Tax=Paramecium sonneborni TaxID=65129 RepID=A0A8S1N225_9CILI|nr:unnamed protein product [Paramecium sonneborni]